MKYTSITCINHLKDDKAHEFCFNFDIEVSLINKNSLLNNYLNIATHKMTWNLHLRCKNIKEEFKILNEFVKILINLRNTNEKIVIIIKEIHVVNNLSCELLIKNDIMKSFDVIIKWSSIITSDSVVIEKH